MSGKGKGYGRPRKLVITKIVKKRNQPRRKRAATATRSRGDVVLAAGSGAITNYAFPKPRSSKGNSRMDLTCWDATMPQHLPLPRAVGAYTTIRTTKVISSDAEVLIFGSFQTAQSFGGYGDARWSTICCVASADASLPIGGTNNTVFSAMPLESLGLAATLVPSAISVQIINANSLQSTVGTVFAGTMSTQAAVIAPAGTANTRTWTQLANSFISFQAPRFMTAPKLSLRGVRVNSYPLNMATVSDFKTINPNVDFTGTWAADTDVVGWAPIVAVNRSPDRPELTYVVTQEWRVRFDLANPASAGHIHHPIASDGLWDRLMRTRQALGSGVEDIPDVIANVGSFARSAAPYMRAASMYMSG